MDRLTGSIVIGAQGVTGVKFFTATEMGPWVWTTVLLELFPMEVVSGEFVVDEDKLNVDELPPP